jgi:hypothetical protein
MGLFVTPATVILADSYSLHGKHQLSKENTGFNSNKP